MTEKKLNGVFYTSENPFNHEAFINWIKQIPNIENEILLEPFAGANNIVLMIKNIGFYNKWHCYDLFGDSPNENSINKTKEFKIKKQDTLKNFPKNYNVCITNPPYLAKNSATRSKLEFPNTKYDDLYKFSLQKMLENVKYIAAIIPESFLTSKNAELKERLHTVISLTNKMFDDTEHPVCLALFSPKNEINKKGYLIYSGNSKIGYIEDILEKNKFLKDDIPKELNSKIKFNIKEGLLGLKAVDSQNNKSIRFIRGEEIEPEKIKISSRSITRIMISPEILEDYEIDLLIDICNLNLDFFREETDDVFLTSFKGLRKDGKYRRRLDFNIAKKIIIKSIKDIRKNNES